MSHENLKDLVFASYDRELSPAEHAAAERHLASCPDCRAALEGWKKAAPLFFHPREVFPSEAFVQKVMDRVEAHEARAADSWTAPLSAFLRTLKASAALRPLVIAGAGSLAALALFLYTPRYSNIAELTPEKADAVAYASDLMEGPYVFAEAEETDMDAEIEEYFYEEVPHA